MFTSTSRPTTSTKKLWRDNPQDNLKECQLCTITYGIKAAPFVAMRTMQQLACDDRDKYPLDAEVLQCQFYVDDLLGGNHSLSDAKEVHQQPIKMFQGAQINLRKWSSNCAELLSSLSANQINPTTVDFKSAKSTKGYVGTPPLTCLLSVQLTRKKQLYVLSEHFCHKFPKYLTHWAGYSQ